MPAPPSPPFPQPKAISGLSFVPLGFAFAPLRGDVASPRATLKNKKVVFLIKLLLAAAGRQGAGSRAGAGRRGKEVLGFHRAG